MEFFKLVVAWEEDGSPPSRGTLKAVLFAAEEDQRPIMADIEKDQWRRDHPEMAKDVLCVLTFSDFIPEPHPQTETPPSIKRRSPVILNPSTRSVQFGKREQEIPDPRAFAIVQLVVDADGQVVPSKDIRKKVPGCNGRIGLFLTRHLPKWVRTLIKGTRGHNGGFSLQLPKKVRNGAQRVRNRT
jgi:hypothetical protein